MPEKLQEAIAKEFNKASQSCVAAAREDLTARYRSSAKQDKLISHDAHRLAYIAARMPATYAVVCRVLEEICARAPQMHFSSLLDLGAGPGTVMWAASDVLKKIQKMTLLENDEGLAAIGKRLAEYDKERFRYTVEWILTDIRQAQHFPQHDLIVMSYSIGEIEPNLIPSIIEKCWTATEKMLVIIEPGTPKGFERIRSIRDQLIDLGGYMVAPCPHREACPMEGGNWCHFAERVERTSLHRRLKEGTLGHEDEKYSYVVFSKTPIDLPTARILRHPEKRSGHVHLTLCTLDGLKQEIVSKRTPEAYRIARKASWGNSY